MAHEPESDGVGRSADGGARFARFGTAVRSGGGLGSASVGWVGRRRTRLRLGRFGRRGGGLGFASVGSDLLISQMRRPGAHPDKI